MPERYFLSAYWGARAESVEKCAERLQDFLEGLCECGGVLGQWYKQPTSRKDLLQKSALNVEASNLIELLLKGQNRENVTREVVKDLGFQVELWNGEKDAQQASINLLCGLYWKSTTAGVSMSNCVVIDLPNNLETLVNPERMSQVLAVTVRAWQPDWAGVISESAMDAREFDAEVPFVDWMIYLPYKVKGVSEPSFVSELRGYGSIVVIQQDPPSLEDAESQALIRKVEGAIKHALA